MDGFNQGRERAFKMFQTRPKEAEIWAAQRFNERCQKRGLDGYLSFERSGDMPFTKAGETCLIFDYTLSLARVGPKNTGFVTMALTFTLS